VKWGIGDWGAVAAAAVAVVSALFAWSSARQAKRQADAVGDVDPTFSTYQQQRKIIAPQPVVAVEIVNHNRRPLLLHEFSFEHPDTVIVFAEQDDLRDLIASIMHSMEKRTQRWDIPLRIRGCGLNSLPESMELKFRCGWKSGEPRTPIKFCFRAEYSLDGKPDRFYTYGCTMVLPETQDL
jgi:hypothetical protein